MRKSRVYIALLHYPMYNKRMDIITTSVTNLDLHDIARTARTYDVERFFVVHPSENQQQLIGEILHYWQEGFGGCYNPDRKEAFDLLSPVHSLDEVIRHIEEDSGLAVTMIATDARVYPNTISYRELKQAIHHEEKAYLLLFGTGWGIQGELMNSCHHILEPIETGRSYNHLSVRSAVAIILDRLLGEFWYQNPDSLENA